MALFVPLILTPFAKRYNPTWAAYMPDLLWQVPSVILAVFVATRVILAPHWLDEEREAQIKDLEKRLENRYTRQAQCDKLADFIDKGESIRRLYAKPGTTPTADAKVWITEVRTYLQETLGRSRITQWEHVTGLPYIQFPKGMLTEDRKVYKTLSFRLVRLREMLEKLTSSMD